MNILISIVSWRAKEEIYLQQVLNEYSESFSDCNPHYVIALNYTSSLSFPANTTFITESNLNCAKFCWACHPYINDNFRNYDYIINSDSDIIITRDNFNYYISQSIQLNKSYIPGFLSIETPDSGSPYLLTMSPLFPRIRKYLEINEKKYIVPISCHSACSIIDRERYQYSFDHSLAKSPCSGNGYNHNDLARSDIYTNGDFTKVISYEGIKNGKALVKHLPNRYWNKPHWRNPRVNELFK